MRRSGSDFARWTADGTHILFTYGAEVWAVTPDGYRLWRLAQAWGQTVRRSLAFGWMTSFDVTPDGQHVVYATCRYPPAGPGGRVAPLDMHDFDFELAVVGLDGRAPRRLTHHDGFDHYPAWSPDGTRIAFVSDRGPGGWRFRLYTMAADGADVRRLVTDLSVAMQPPAWSPDGRSIAVIGGRQRDEGPGLYLVHADGTGFLRLADAVSGGAWSPDGTRLAFAQPESPGVALYTIAADSADARRVTTVPPWQTRYGAEAWIPTVAWSPDGAKLLHLCGYRQFCVVTRDGEPVGSSLGGDWAVWSPDGKRIAVASPQAPDPTDGSHPIVVYSAAPDGSDVKPLALEGGVGLIAAQAAEEDLATSRAACPAGFVVPAPEANPGLVHDCATLLAARAALFGWRLVNWGSGSPLDQWEGVTITGAPPRVTGLDLNNKDLPGTISPELENLPQLKDLYLGGNRLTGCIPAGLKRVPDNDLAELGLPDCEAGS